MRDAHRGRQNILNMIDKPAVKEFQEGLYIWARANPRPLPWKSTKDPYAIWLSEILLQQTRVEQGTPYYHAFMKHFPTVRDLADAEETAVIKLWQGLGYYSRARNLHAAAKRIVSDFGGRFPSQYSDIRALPGVGDYTAAAIASFAYDLPYPVLDGNVSRVISRHEGILDFIDSTVGKSRIGTALQCFFDQKAPAAFNQAIMDFGATHCTPQKPKCDTCPFQKSCTAFSRGLVHLIPKKKPKSPKTTRCFHYFLIRNGREILLHHRDENDIWRKMYDLPHIENHREERLSDTECLEKVKSWFTDIYWPTTSVNFIESTRHMLTHQHLILHFYEVQSKSDFPLKLEDCIPIEKTTLIKFPLPKPIRDFLVKYYPNL